ncbi:MAG: ion channel [Putridiphycobacter sp.]
MGRIKDPGFGTGFKYRTKRIVNPDGTFNIVRKGAFIKWKDAYKYLIELSWVKFIAVLFLIYVLLNLIFTGFYWVAGFEKITGVTEDKGPLFLQVYYFSVQTFTTVGYGVMSPTGLWPQLISSIEAFVGFLSFSLATGLLYGRFSKPIAKIQFSEKALITNYKGGIKSFQIKIVNARDNVLLDVSAKLILVMDTSNESLGFKKQYYQLPLEIDKLNLLPLSWTIVHPIDSESPLFGLNEKQMQDLDIEVLVLVTGFDEVFSQHVHSKKSYVTEEFIWNKRFKKIFSANKDGNILLDLHQLNVLED